MYGLKALGRISIFDLHLNEHTRYLCLSVMGRRLQQKSPSQSTGWRVLWGHSHTK